MQKDRRMLLRRATFLLIDSLMIVVFLTVWMVAQKSVPIERTITYNRASDHILVQITQLAGDSGEHMHTSPMWTLYGDGTLIFRTDTDDNLWRAQLSTGEIQHILDVVINQNTFFKNTAQRYGSTTPGTDDDGLLLMVDAHAQQQEADLVREPTNQVATDLQTTHVFTIEQFLLDYHPLHSVFYALNPDPILVSDDGK